MESGNGSQSGKFMSLSSSNLGMSQQFAGSDKSGSVEEQLKLLQDNKTESISMKGNKNLTCFFDC